ncbi:MAG TPA: restriction endonuclease subunit S [Acinetobacter towneri]|uniref:restriction endonuclease subunit S n=1 Tax=Acinetobacter sp. ANC 5045 TaxID=2529851 RepID=UPI00103AC36A|nr:restriction endonuclease subunit S [Acinetobacter sp. ANC 5045]TCB14017.1 restriction endonuclease subunit S [Acinetobacter sp. ANC 5045]HRO78251.1 restriction endonuclease subunit S [Acinetobacter towneri]
MATPKLRFKDFDGHWTKSKLGDLCVRNYQGINTVADKVEYQKTGYPILQAKHITSEKLDFDDVRFLSDLDFEKYRKKYIPKTNDILFSNIGTIGKVVLVGESEPFFIAWNIFLISVKTDLVAPFYLATYLRRLTSLSYFDNLQTGNATKFINKTDLLDTGVTLPSKLEQTKIASFLSAVDEKISQLTQKHELLNQYKQGMMQKLFSQQLRFKADDGSEFGEWEDKPLNEIASKRSGKNKDGSISEVLTNSATQGIIKQSDYFEREIVTESNLNGYYIVNLDDFVYNPRISVHAPVGPIKRNKKCLGVMSPLYTVFTVVEGNLAYLEYFFDSNFWHDYVKGVANSGARHDRMNITNKDFFDMPILYPCLEEQTKIANFLSAIDQKIEVVAQQIEQAKLWKKGLLQQMFV